MKKNIWLMNHYATDMFFNQGGRHYWFAENLLKQGYKPTVFCANTFHNKIGDIDTGRKKYCLETVNDIPFVFVKTSPYKGNGLSRIKNMVLFAKNLISVAKDYAKNHGKPDVILASSVHPLTLVAGLKIAKKFKAPCICEVRDLWPEAIFTYGSIKETSLTGKILLAGERWIYEKADAIIFTKEGEIEYLKERKWDIEQGGKISLNKCYYINNGVDIENFEKAIINTSFDDEDLESKTFKVIYAGAIRPVNNVGNILEGAALLASGQEIEFLIYGDGEETPVLKQKAQDNRLSNVKFKGYVSKQYIPYILSKSSVNLLNYSSTMFNWSRGNSSNKLFEYMASGKPVISTVTMGYSIIDKYNCGLSLRENTPEELAQAILTIKNMTRKQYDELCANARRGAADFDFKVLTDKLMQVIESV